MTSVREGGEGGREEREGEGGRERGKEREGRDERIKRWMRLDRT